MQEEPQSRYYAKSTNKIPVVRKSNSPVVLHRSPHVSQTSKMLSIDLRNMKPKPSYKDGAYNPLIELTDNPRREELLVERGVRNPRDEYVDSVRKNMYSYDFNKQYLTNPVSVNGSKKRVEVEVDKLMQKSAKRFEYINH